MEKDRLVGWKFRVENPEDMEALARAFAAVAYLNKRPAGLPHDILRIGLKGKPDTGKSVFAKGFLSAFNRTSVQDFPSSRFRTAKEQSLSETKEAGSVRHYDAIVDNILPSRAAFTLEKEGKPGTDLAEHVDSDYGPFGGKETARNKCDYLVSLRQEFYSNARQVRIRCRAQLAQTEGFKEFLKAAAPFLTEKSIYYADRTSVDRFLRGDKPKKKKRSRRKKRPGDPGNSQQQQPGALPGLTPPNPP